ncbi:MAG: long-chain fatty acid--CoA ligase [Veillonellaceae bacterium]|jgi:long-chain acyl-CoA synthetase|nr:long-chain fatty acid--CoA ligase [Veillonellaceae bacterium]
MHVTDLFIRSLDRSPNKTALIWESGSLTYYQLYRIILSNIKIFSQNSIQANDRVVIHASNGPEFLAAYFALSFIGAIPVTIGPKSTICELKKMCDTVKAYKIAAESSVYAKLKKHLPNCSIALITTEPDRRGPGRFKQLGSTEYGQIRFTSGTTGKVKAVLLSQTNLTWRLEQPGTHCLSDDVFICCIPFTYRIIKVLLAIGMGATIISMKSFTIKTLASYLEKYPATWIWGTPGIYNVLTDGLAKEALKSIRGVSSLGSYLPPKIQELFQNKFGCNIYQNYGLAEAMDSTEMSANEVPLFGSVGKLRAGVEVKFLNIDNDQGEILLRGPNVMLGYINGAQLTSEGIEDGWLRTGDLGYMDKAGYLYITGRKKQIINVDGLKVVPQEIEEVLYQLSGVNFVKVIGKQDSLRGEIPAAYIKLDSSARLSKAEVKRHCLERLSPHKVPRQIEFVEAIALRENGKFDQRSCI